MSKRIKRGKEKVSNFLFFQHMFIYPGFVSGQILFNTHPFLYPNATFFQKHSTASAGSQFKCMHVQAVSPTALHY